MGQPAKPVMQSSCSTPTSYVGQNPSRELTYWVPQLYPDSGHLAIAGRYKLEAFALQMWGLIEDFFVRSQAARHFEDFYVIITMKLDEIVAW